MYNRNVHINFQLVWNLLLAGGEDVGLLTRYDFENIDVLEDNTLTA